MRIFHDWEFLEDGKTIKPISVGMVREDGEELYYEFADAPWDAIYKHEWLKDNVVPHLTCTRDGSLVAGFGTKTFKGAVGIRGKVYDFLKEAHELDGPMELWGWYSAYDHVCLAQLFGRMIDLPEFVPMWTNDLRQLVHAVGNPFIPNQHIDGENVHNALDDARAELRKFNWLQEWLLNQNNKQRRIPAYRDPMFMEH